MALVIWLENANNVGREVDAKTLFNDLRGIAESEKFDWDYKSTIGFAKRLKNVFSNLAQLLTAVERKDKHGRKYYSFSPIKEKVADGVTE
jgi:hypothetical protein